MKKFYVYLYLRENLYSPYYVGKGAGNRDIGKHAVSVPKDRNRIRRVATNLTEEDAFALERLLIKFYGRKCEGGILYNLTEGGEGCSGRVLSVEARKRISEARKAHKEKRHFVERRAESQRQFYRTMSQDDLQERMDYEIRLQPNRQEIILDCITFPSINSAARYCFDKYGLGKTTAYRYLKAGIHPSQKIRKARKPQKRHGTYC